MIIYVLTRIEITDDADPQEVIAECDYDFTHDKIVATEIISVENE